MSATDAAAYRHDDPVLELLRQTTSATVQHLMVTKGMGDLCLAGLRPLASLGLGKVAGRAVTVRYLPARPDSDQIRKQHVGVDTSPLLQAIEQLGPGAVLVIDALGRTNCGLIGDILVGRMIYRQAEAVLVDGGVRDAPILRTMKMPVYCTGIHPAATRDLFPYEANVPVNCGGALVCPGDYILCDDEGAVVIPAAVAEQIAQEAVKKERLEGIAREMLLEGSKIEDVYPPGPNVEAEYKRRQAVAASKEEDA